jgi:hypothetical protein
MASFLIAEYAEMAAAKSAGVGTGVPSNVALPLVQEPPIAIQTAITLSSSSQASAAFSSRTTVLRVWTDADDVYQLVGTSPTATTACPPLGVAGTYYLAVRPGDKIAVRTA